MTSRLRCDTVDELIDCVIKYENNGYEVHYQSRHTAIVNKGEDVVKIYVSEDEEI